MKSIRRDIAVDRSAMVDVGLAGMPARRKTEKPSDTPKSINRKHQKQRERKGSGTRGGT
jgi:hypothetical protein